MSDVFSSKAINKQPPTKSSYANRPPPKFEIAREIHTEVQQKQQDDVASRSQTDSGYHGSQEMETDAPPQVGNAEERSLHSALGVALIEQEKDIETQRERRSDTRRTTTGSFHSAKEEHTAKAPAIEASTIVEMPEAEKEAEQQEILVEREDVQAEQMMEDVSKSETQSKAIDFEHEFDDIGSPSDGSTPDRPLVRKSSLTFASLPAREPLKTSIGGRISRTSQLDQSKILTNPRTSYAVRQTGGVANSNAEVEALNKTASSADHGGNSESEDDAATSRFHKQSLHEKIDMLGKSRPSRLSKSIPSATALAAAHMKQSEAANKSDTRGPVMPSSELGEDDDWIKPLSSENEIRPAVAQHKTVEADQEAANDPDATEDEDEMDWRAPELIAHEERMMSPKTFSPTPGKVMPGFGHNKSASTATLASPAKSTMAPPVKHSKHVSVSNPPLASTTPQGSPKKKLDGTLSASKSRFQSIMKTAKGLFSSGASASAAAKMETLSPNALRMAQKNMPGLYPNLSAMLEDKPLPSSPPKESRKTRSSTEREKDEKKREKEIKAQQKAEEQLQKAREKEEAKAAASKDVQQKAAVKADAALAAEEQSMSEMSTMPPPAAPQSKLSRPTKPMRVNSVNRPAPSIIRVGTMSQRGPASAAVSLTCLSEILNSAPPKRPEVVRKASNASISSSVAGPSFKTSITAKPKALLAAERKREQDEREAQRKLELKKENERKRKDQQEELKRQEQKQRADAERKERERLAAEQAKRAAQQQAIERKKLENAKKAEQQRLERAAIEAGQSRPQSRLGSAQPPNRSVLGHSVPMNPAKPAKRPLEEDTASRPTRPGLAVQHPDAKRRRTDDEQAVEPPSRPTMSGAPIRQSNNNKKPSIFNHSAYTTTPAAPPVQSHVQLFPQPPPHQQNAHPTAMSKFANGNKIPFAEIPNPPAFQHQQHPAFKQPPPPSSYHSKTTIAPVRSSPQLQHPPGENIHLPEIPTDSEDEDSDGDAGAFPVPDWATPGHLTNQLMAQEGLDGDAVFGPIAPLKMEEIFSKGDKARLKKMRMRTSSANWVTSGDGLTLEEVRKDREMRDRIRIQGGWGFGQ